MDCYCFHIKEKFTVEEAWQELESVGLPLLYSTEDMGGEKEIYGYLPAALSLGSLSSALRSVASITPTTLQIDWTEQWALHSPGYREGFVTIDLHEFGVNRVLQLQPGPGFGDLSHPTTHLVLKMMQHRVSGSHVIDIGTGSGVLALCAVAMGARFVYAIDIDSEALEHAKSNAVLNQMQERIHFCLPEQLTLPDEIDRGVVLMNMIRSEQKQAWTALPHLHGLEGESIVSGILSKERHFYLRQCEEWGWRLKEERAERGWNGFCFTRAPYSN